MIFNSLEFPVFFILVLSLVAILKNKVTYRNIVILIASYIFYGLWDWRFLSLIAFSTVVDYYCGLFLGRMCEEEKKNKKLNGKKKFILLISIVTNLGILGFFKYFNFFIGNFSSLMDSLGLPFDTYSLNIILPVGISFYTFQTLSYTIDCYKGTLKPERSLLNFAVFVSFFPQLVAGPIERASRLIPQVSRPTTINWELLQSGFYLICWGLFKKVVVADNLSPFVDQIYSLENPTSAEIILGTYAFSIQIFCDFSGYSDIARGTARCMGFELMQNFRRPYFATNPSDFWKRWHISLSTWLRDYLYIPLGGNKGSSFNVYRNLMITMILGGIWHGAAWNFVIWGAYQGTLLCGYRFVSNLFKFNALPNWNLKHFLSVIIFYQFVCYGWLLFRADSLAQIIHFTNILLYSFSFSLNGINSTFILGVFSCIIVGSYLWWESEKRGCDEVVLRSKFSSRLAFYSLVYFLFIFIGNYSGDSFIYFQF
jgi:alginate O-acetyltransferase complex protein AlgI